MAFIATGNSTYPRAAYAPIDAIPSACDDIDWGGPFFAGTGDHLLWVPAAVPLTDRANAPRWATGRPASAS